MSENTSRTVLYKNDKCCQECQLSSTMVLSGSVRRQCQTDYKGSAPSGDTQKTKEKPKELEERRKSNETKKIGTVVFSTNTTKVNKPALTLECPYRRRCYQCKDFVQRIRSLLDEIKTIRKNVTTGAVCDFCKRYSIQGPCRRCEYLQDRYKISENIEEDARQQRFKIWLCKVKQFLYTILERETCTHKVYSKTPATDELTNLLHELKSPLTIREPEIGYFPSIDSLENLTESKDILEEVLTRLRSEKRSEDFMPDATCICKFFADKKLEETVSEKELSIEEPVPPPTPKDAPEKGEVQIKKSKPKVPEPKKLKEKPAPKEKQIPKEKSLPKVKPPRPPKEEKKPKADPKKAEADLLAKMMKMQEKEPKPMKQPKPEKLPVLPKIDALPEIKTKEPKEADTATGSIIECDLGDREVTEMIKGTKIVPIEPRKDLETGSVVPLLFKTAPDCPEPKAATVSTATPASVALSDKVTMKKTKSKVEDDDKALPGKGVISYMLSDREFIEKGWTLLPTTKIMRRMNIYKMVPANPKLDWFERNKLKRVLYYPSGEKLAEIQEDSSGKLYYKNGNVALDYYCYKEGNTGFRYVIYSCGDYTDAGRKLPVTVLASFDYQGNAVVYDHYGNERLKYNQSEGMVFDAKIGPPGRWKWHTLNEPPVLQPVFVDLHVRPNPCLEKFMKNRKDDEKLDPTSRGKKEPNLDMLAIELENFLKEKAQALLQEFKPFHIRTKAMKLNEQFSLKVFDQANVNLMFRDGLVSIKLNLGMLLISDEIVDTDTSEVTQVATPYDHRPPKSESIADIQVALERARKLGKARGKLRN